MPKQVDVIEKVNGTLQVLSGLWGSCKTENDSKGITKVTIPFKDYKGDYFYFYIFKKLNLYIVTDGGVILRSLKGCGDLRLQSIQDVLATFGLSLMEDLTIMDTSNRPVPDKVMSLIQACCSIDGIIRAWNIHREEIKDALRPTRKSSGNDEGIWSGYEDHSLNDFGL
jgi:hypothetical protein